MRNFLVVFGCFFVFSLNAADNSWDIQSRKAVDAFAQQMAKKHRMVYLLQGQSDLVDATSSHQVWSISWMDRQARSYQEARSLIIELIQAFLWEVENNPVYRKSQVELQRLYPKMTPAVARMSASASIGIKYACWDAHYDRYPAPCISLVRVADEKIYYYHADPHTQALIEVAVESFGAIPELAAFTKS